MNRLMTAVICLALLCAPAGALAEKLCFRIVNRTNSPLKIENKEGDRSYSGIKPYSLTPVCCDNLYERLCFDKSDGSSKIKINALVGDPPREFSGEACRKIYAKPGQAILVSRDLDGVHIRCRIIEDGQHVDVVADFDELDANNDGKLDASETRGMDMKPMHYSQVDHNGDKIINRREYNSFIQRINVFRGVEF
ncbi:MAG: hypothetical protein ACOCVM_04840 [Desulfovibrionaceae bacterium]